MSVDLKADHVHGGFEWEKEPACSCGQFAQAIEDKVIFVSNFTVGGCNLCYFLPLDADGELYRSDGVNISHCPWCGDKIEARKKYPRRSAPARKRGGRGEH